MTAWKKKITNHKFLKLHVSLIETRAFTKDRGTMLCNHFIRESEYFRSHPLAVF